MRCDVLTPIGPGHEKFAEEAKASVAAAMKTNMGIFDQIGHLTVSGLPRSAARNKLMRDSKAHWFFFLDADDTMLKGAFAGCAGDCATFGRVFTDKHGYPKNESGPISRREMLPTLMRLGARGTLSMGAFFPAPEARSIGFDETLHAGEDFDFYLRYAERYPMQKKKATFVRIGVTKPSAGGEFGYTSLDWVAACDAQVERRRGCAAK